MTFPEKTELRRVSSETGESVPGTGQPHCEWWLATLVKGRYPPKMVSFQVSESL